MKLQIEKNTVTDLHLVKSEEVDDFDELEPFSFSYDSCFPKGISNAFQIIFSLRLKVKESHILFVDFESVFQTQSEIEENFKNGSFPKVNAPAIAFPYLRAFISTFLLNAGFEPIMLPSINFQAMSEKQKIK